MTTVASQIPPGWRFYTADASLCDKVSVQLRRDQAGLKWWLSLPHDEQNAVALYYHGIGSTFEEALEEAIKKVREKD